METKPAIAVIKKFEINLWPKAPARRWIWLILAVCTFALLAYGALISHDGFGATATLLGISSIAIGSVYFASSRFSNHRFIYLIELLAGGILRCSNIWRTHFISLQEIKMLKLYTAQHIPGDAEIRESSHYGQILHHGGTLTTDILSDTEFKALRQFFAELERADPRIELQAIEIPFSGHYYGFPTGS